MSTTEISAYAQAAGSGRYDRVTGLQGKYDNVRVHWEDQAVRLRLRPHMQARVDRQIARGRPLRLLDLGCGSGDGVETLTGMLRDDASPTAHRAELFPAERIGRYTGVELNPALLDQARERHRHLERAEFLQADLREGLPFDTGVEPYDIYFASYGTLSHLGEADTAALLAEIANHAEDGSLIVADWLGRYAYEWADLWDADTSRECWMDYRISYIYSEEDRKTREIDSFPLRLLCAEEARRVFGSAAVRCGHALHEKDLFDRSLFVGRHMETAEYNAHARPLRSVVNRLHEPLHRTDLDALLFDLYVPEGFAEPAGILRDVHRGWEALVRFTAEGLACVEAGASLPAIPGDVSAVTGAAMRRVAAAIEVMESIEADDARSEWIEPQLALALRNIELGEQRGCGCGHGLVAIYEVRK